MLIDIIYAVLIAIACVKGYRKGLIMALFSFIALIIGLTAALKLSVVVAGHLKDSVHISSKWLPFISFILVFIVALLLVKWTGKLIEKTFEAVMLGWANRLGGIILYAAIYTIILSIFLFYAEKIHLLQTSVIQASYCYPFIKPWAPEVMDGLGSFVPSFKNMFEQLESFFASVQQKLPS